MVNAAEAFFELGRHDRGIEKDLDSELKKRGIDTKTTIVKYLIMAREHLQSRC
jgi:hypothetical protein